MDYKYYMAVVAAQKENLRKAEAVANADALRSYAASIARNLRKAAAVMPSQAASLLAEAEKYDTYAETYLASDEARAAKPKTIDPSAGKSEPQTKGEPQKRETPKGGKLSARDAMDGKTSYDFGMGRLITSAMHKTFDDIVGMDDVKEEITLKLIKPLRYPETFARYGLSAGGYILLYGPPGTGKTTFAQAVAGGIGVPFVFVKCSDLVSKYVGETGHNITYLFSRVRSFAEEYDTPVVLFLDEVDSIGRKRDSGDVTSASSVPTLLQELEGFETTSRNIILIAATNHKEMIDNALLSRFTSIYVPLPDFAARRALFELKAKSFHFAPEDIAAIDFDAAATASEGLSGRKIDDAMKALARELALRDAGEAQTDETITRRLLRHIEHCRREENR